MKKGFSLIELLIGIGLIAVIIGTANVFLFSLVRSAKKAEASGVTKAEGSYAMTAMTQVIKFSRKINCIGTMPEFDLQITRLNNEMVTYKLLGTKIASISGTPAINQALTSDAVTVAKCTNGTPMFSCDTDLKSVNICFIVSKAGSANIEDMASNKFENTVTVRNIDN